VERRAEAQVAQRRPVQPEIVADRQRVLLSASRWVAV